MSVNNYLGVIFIGLCFFSCAEPTYLPKPRGYPRIHLPAQTYKPLPNDFKAYPYAFEVNSIAEVLPDTSGVQEPYWMLLVYPDYKAQVALTYKPLTGDTMDFYYLNDDARRLTNKHNIKAYAIDESQDIKTKDGQSAIIFSLAGEVATQFQFITTDSSQNFFRGALYFTTATENDSLAPVINYITKDMVHLLETFSWNEDFDRSVYKLD